MNDKDKEAFEEWADVKTIAFSASAYEAWRNACEYKQKEIDELIKQLKHEHDLYKRHLKVYEDENAKLIECVEFYADEANQIAPIYKHDGRNRPGADFTAPYRMDEGKRARQVLKELEDK